MAMHLVLVGGGHAMLPTLAHADRWTRDGIDVSLIDPHRHLYYSGMMPEHLGGVYARDEIRIDLSRLCRSAKVRQIAEAVDHVDAEAQTVTTDAGRTLSYDVLALDVGGVNPHHPAASVATKPIAHLQAVEERIRQTLADPDASLRMTIVGGGAAGVEIAMNVLGRFHAAGRSANLSLTVLETEDRLLSRFPAGMSAHVARQLRARGATLRFRTRVTTTTADEVLLADDSTLPSDVVIWATGSVGPAFLRTSGMPTDDRGFLQVTPGLHPPGQRRVFAAGDCATVAGYDHLQKVGVHAIKQGPVLRSNLDRTLHALRATGRAPATKDLQLFRPYPIAPLILSTGTRDGLWTAGSVWVRHPLMLRLKHYIDRAWIRDYAPRWGDASLSTLIADDAPQRTTV
jgi:selenide,water dikinase